MLTVTAASSGVKSAQADVLHSLYGVGTDITVTQAATAGSGGPGGFGFGFGGSGRTGGTRPSPGTKINTNRVSTGFNGPVSTDAVTSIGKLGDVAAASGALVLNDIKISLTIGNFGFGGGGGAVGWRGQWRRRLQRAG